MRALAHAFSTHRQARREGREGSYLLFKRIRDDRAKLFALLTLHGFARNGNKNSRLGREHGIADRACIHQPEFEYYFFYRWNILFLFFATRQFVAGARHIANPTSFAQTSFTSIRTRPSQNARCARTRLAASPLVAR